MGKNILAIDIGGSKFLIGIVNTDGEVLAVERYKWSKMEKEAVMGDIICAVRDFMTKQVEECYAIGVTIPGLADVKNGIWVEASFSQIRNLNIGERLTKEFGLPTYIDNDVNACAIGEKIFGCCKDTSDFVWITISNGIGGAIYLNNNIYYGAYDNAGEIGHLVIKDQGRKCNCGSFGCLEMHAAGPAIPKNYVELLNKDLNSMDSNLTAQMIAEKAYKGEKIALKTYELEGKYLGKAIASVVNILNPKKVVLGGGVMLSFDLFEQSLLEEYKKNVYNYANKNVVITKTELGYNAALVGAAAIVVKHMGGN